MTETEVQNIYPRSAVVLGGTGLVGQELVQQLVSDNAYEKVTLLLRRSSQNNHPKIDEHIIDFEKPETWQHHINGNVLFSALGTTIRVAKTKEAQFRVDHDYQLWAAQAAAKNGVANYVLISSAGANEKSPIFYSRIKGQLENEVSALGFESCNLLRPGILDGDRAEHRTLERLSLKVLRRIPTWAMPPSARPSPVEKVARTCILADRAAQPGKRIIEAAEILEA